MNQSAMKNTIIKGTMILTIAGILTKLLGFYNRIFLSGTIGAREIGIYQLIFPVYLIVHCFSCQGFEMGITKFVAEETSFGNRSNVSRYLKYSMISSLSLALLSFFVVFCYNEFIAIHLLKQADCALSLKILSFAFPLISIKDCIHAYFYAMKKTGLPAGCQLFEQCTRVFTIWFLATCVLTIKKDAALATIGLVAGEASATLLTLCFIPKMRREIHNNCPSGTTAVSSKHPRVCLSGKTILKQLYSFCFPLIGNRLLLTVLSSVESVFVPFILAKNIGDEDTALEMYGAITGMALTFILFPSALTNAVAMMLLPTISEAKAQNKQLQIKKAADYSLHYCFLLGILCTGIFLAFGKDLGNLVFRNEMAGQFLFVLAWLCPFIYVATTFTSILNGLGYTSITFSNNIIAILIRILSILAGIPIMGIMGYLIGLLISYATLAILCVYHVHKYTNMHFNAKRSILTPAFLVVFCLTFAYIVEFALLQAGFPLSLFTLFITIGIMVILFLILGYILRLFR